MLTFFGCWIILYYIKENNLKKYKKVEFVLFDQIKYHRNSNHVCFWHFNGGDLKYRRIQFDSLYDIEYHQRKSIKTYLLRILLSFLNNRLVCNDDWSLVLPIKLSFTGNGREIYSSEEIGSINKIHIIYCYLNNKTYRQPVYWI